MIFDFSETKAYHKACEDRKACQIELAAAQLNMIEIKIKNQKEMDAQQMVSSRSHASHSHRSPKRTIGLRLPFCNNMRNVNENFTKQIIRSVFFKLF